MAKYFGEQLKKTFAQDLFEASATQKERIGTVWKLNDGRVFVYSQNGASNLAAGVLLQTPAVVANHLNQSVAASASVGATSVSVTLGATAVTENYYKDGFLHINTADGAGHYYKVKSHAAIGSAGTGTIHLFDEIRAALTTSSKFTLISHPNKNVVVFPTTQTGAPCGVCPIPVTAAYYFWAQVKGPCAVLTEGTIVIGNMVIPGTTTAGSVKAAPTDEIIGSVGRVLSVNATTHYSLINLAIPGY